MYIIRSVISKKQLLGDRSDEIILLDLLNETNNEYKDFKMEKISWNYEYS